MTRNCKLVWYRVNCFMVILNLIFLIIFAIFAGNLIGCKTDEEGEIHCFDMDNYRTFESGDNIIKGVLCILCCLVFIPIVLFGCCAACCRNWCCGIVLSILTFIFGVIFFGIGGILYMQGDRLYQMVCDGGIKDTIHKHYDNFVDRPMCSELCPCEHTNYDRGAWDTISADVLAEFGRAPRLTDDAGDLLKLMTDLDSPSNENLGQLRLDAL